MDVDTILAILGPAILLIVGVIIIIALRQMMRNARLKDARDQIAEWKKGHEK